MDVVALVVRPRDQPLAQVLGHVRRRAQGHSLALEIQPQRPFGKRIHLGRVQMALLGHLGQYQVAALLGALGILHRVVVARALEHAYQRGALQQVQLVGRLVKVGACGHLDAESVVQERDGVEVGFKNLGLGIHRLDFQRGDGLFDLARDARGAANFFGVKVARQLLRNGRSTLQITRQGVERGPYRSPKVNAMVLVEAVVFRIDQCVQHIRRYLVQSHPLAVDALVLGQHRAVGRQQNGG